MNFKEEMKKALIPLKRMGYDRRTIEKELGYSDKYIDQVLSRGGNDTVLKELQRYLREKSNNNIAHQTIPPTKAEELTALRAAVKVLTLELVQLKAKATDRDPVLVELEVQNMMQLARQQLMNESS